MRAAHRVGGSHRVGAGGEGEVFIPEGLLRIHRQVRAEVAGKKLEHRCIRPTHKLLFFCFWHFFGISLAFGTASTPKPFVSSSTAPQYKAGDITKVGCDIDTMLQAPFGSSPEQIEATSWYRQNYASTGPLTGSRVHMGRADATGPDAIGLVPPEGSSAGEYIQWFGRMRLSIPALVNLSPYGKFILILVWAIVLTTSCFVYSGRLVRGYSSRLSGLRRPFPRARH